MARYWSKSKLRKTRKTLPIADLTKLHARLVLAVEMCALK
jgi:hypothetical protein